MNKIEFSYTHKKSPSQYLDYQCDSRQMQVHPIKPSPICTPADEILFTVLKITGVTITVLTVGEMKAGTVKKEKIASI